MLRSEVSLGGARCTLGPGIALGLDFRLARGNTGGELAVHLYLTTSYQSPIKFEYKPLEIPLY